MKIKIELDSDLNENEIIIRCPALSEEIQMLQQVISDAVPEHPRMTFYKGNVQYFLNLEDILFLKRRINGSMSIRQRTSSRPDRSCMSWRNYCPAIFCGYQNPPY